GYLVPDVHHFRAWLLHRMDRDLLHCGAAVPARVHRRGRQSGLAGNLGLRESADLAPHAAIRMVVVFSARRRAARGEDRPYLSWRNAFRSAAGPLRRAVLPVSAAGAMASQSDRLVTGAERIRLSRFRGRETGAMISRRE